VPALIITGKVLLQLGCQLLNTCLIPSVLNLLLMLQQVLGLSGEMPCQIKLLRILLVVGRKRVMCSVTLNSHHVRGVTCLIHQDMLVILCGRYPQLKICELVLLGWRLVYLLLLLWWLLWLPQLCQDPAGLG
jgi:hypothetical protein